jgi:hypothetical protein
LPFGWSPLLSHGSERRTASGRVGHGDGAACPLV